LEVSNDAITSSSSFTIAAAAAPRYANPFLAHGLLECLAVPPDSSGLPVAPAPAAVPQLPSSSISRDALTAFLGHTLLAHQKAAEDRARNRGGNAHARAMAAMAAAGATTSASSAAPLQLSSSLQQEVDIALAYLRSHNLLEAAPRNNGNDPAAIVSRASDLGCAFVDAGLGPREGLRLYAELVDARSRGLSLSSSLQLCWLLTPEPAVLWFGTAMDVEADRWGAMAARWEQMNKEERAVCRALPVPNTAQKNTKGAMAQRLQQQQSPAAPANPYSKAARFGTGAGMSAHQQHQQQPALTSGPASLADVSFLHRLQALSHDWVSQATRGTSNPSDPMLCAYMRVWHALMLHDLLDDGPSRSLFNAGAASGHHPLWMPARGELQSRLSQAALQCGQVISLCERLGWRDMALLFALYRERFAHSGAPSERLALLRHLGPAAGLKLPRARILAKAGLDSVEKIVALGSPQRLAAVFAANRAAPPSSALSTHGGSSTAAAAAAAAQEAARCWSLQQEHRDQEQAVELYVAARRVVAQNQAAGFGL
jgi:hypothetical protein